MDNLLSQVSPMMPMLVGLSYTAALLVLCWICWPRSSKSQRLFAGVLIVVAIMTVFGLAASIFYVLPFLLGGAFVIILLANLDDKEKTGKTLA